MRLAQATSPAHRWMAVIWPAFLAAAVLEMLVFALVDPAQLHWAGQAQQWPDLAVYTVAFFVFWSVALMASALTALLALPPVEVNRRPGGVSGRPED